MIPFNGQGQSQSSGFDPIPLTCFMVPVNSTIDGRVWLYLFSSLIIRERLISFVLFNHSKKIDLVGS